MGLTNSAAWKLPLFFTPTEDEVGEPGAANALAQKSETANPPECAETGEFDWAPQLATLSDTKRTARQPDGIDFSRLVEGDVIELKTLNRKYVLEYRGRGEALLSGHPDICPEPTPALVYGSSWDGRNLRLGFLGAGLCLEFSTADHPFCRSSRIQSLQVRD